MSIKRSCGVLLPLFSLPSENGIGTLGRAAHEFVDFLAAAGQSWWQILPVGPAGSGDSPYQSFSSFAGNAYFIDLDMLVDDGLLTKDEIEAINWGGDAESVDYDALRKNRMTLLRRAARRGLARENAQFEAFCRDNARWLSDFALYMALKEHFSGSAWYEWPEDIRLHRIDAVEKYSDELREDVSFFSYVQYLFYSQWSALRGYAKKNGIGIIGDMPIYVALDSADVWAEPEFFLLDEKNVPVEVAGVPPDVRRMSFRRPVSFGAIPCTTGTLCGVTATAGGYAASTVRQDCMTRCALTISAHLRATGLCRMALKAQSRGSGGPDRVWILSGGSPHGLITSDSLPRISVCSRPRCISCCQTAGCPA